jgi:hypothetical protein
MADDNNANRSERVADDRVGKIFIRIFTNGDLQMNPMMFGECVVCGGVFTGDQTREHCEARCQPSPEQPLPPLAATISSSLRSDDTTAAR